MFRLTALFLHWMCFIFISNAQQPSSADDFLSTIHLMWDPNELIRRDQLLKEFIKAQQAFNNALLMKSMKPFDNILDPFQRQQLLDALPQPSASFLQRLYSTYNAIKQPFLGNVLNVIKGNNNAFDRNLTKIAMNSIRNLAEDVKATVDSHPREIPNVGGFKSSDDEITNNTISSEWSDESQQDDTSQGRDNNTTLRAKISQPDYYDYIDEQGSSAISQSNDDTTVIKYATANNPNNASANANSSQSTNETLQADDMVPSQTDDHHHSSPYQAPRAQSISLLLVNDEHDEIGSNETLFRKYLDFNSKPMEASEEYNGTTIDSEIQKNKQPSYPSLSSSVDELINAMNITKQQAKAFLIIIEKILEEELQKRAEIERSSADNIHSLSANKSSKIASGIERDSVKSDEKNDPNLEFSFDEKALDEEVKEFGTPLDKSTNHRLRELTTSDLQIQFHNNHRMAHLSSQKARSADLFKTSKALQRKPALKISLSGNDNARIVENYKQVEQEEYDKFISSLQNQLSVENPETTSATQLIVSDKEATPTITTVASSELPTVPVSPIIPALPIRPYSSYVTNNKHNLPPLQHNRLERTNNQHINTGPRNLFQSQVRDFRSRLWGNNGFDDIIKAIQHANIGFYGRPSHNRL